jgi:esterase/lipase
MKKILILLLVCCNSCFAQSDEAKQLLLNVEKLAQFKQILKNMKDGYQLLHKGYTSIKDISEGNFSLHKTFLDGLMEVSPAVKKYKRVADIISYQIKLVKEYKSAFQQFKDDKQFTLIEIQYIGNVYANLFKESLKKLDELAMVVTAGKLRMSDDERLQAIDRIYDEVMEQYTFLNEFNNSTAILSLQREKDKMDIDLMKKIHGLK